MNRNATLNEELNAFFPAFKGSEEAAAPAAGTLTAAGFSKIAGQVRRAGGKQGGTPPKEPRQALDSSCFYFNTFLVLRFLFSMGKCSQSETDCQGEWLPSIGSVHCTVNQAAWGVCLEAHAHHCQAMLCRARSVHMLPSVTYVMWHGRAH